MEIIKLNKENFPALIRRNSLAKAGVLKRVAEIVDDVAANGNKSLIAYTEKFDGVKLAATELRLTEIEIQKSAKAVKPKVIDAFKLASKRIRDYHKRQKRSAWKFNINGAELGLSITALERVGVYVPGGRANYPSSVMMNVIPAQVAGVREIALCCPPNANGNISAYVLAAAEMLGIKEIYRIGGAQAIAALAFGTETIKKVDKITGPGNIYVTQAKKLVLGEVGIDMPAGPSEVVIIADERANPAFIAADMLAQAEHDPMATAILVTTSRKIALEAAAAIEDQLEHLSRRHIAVKSLQTNGKVVITENLEAAIEFVNRIAPEHLEIMTARPRNILTKIKNAGAIFLGDYTPEALGDYIAGSNHILPTGGTARFYSPLGVDDFIKKTSVLSFSREAVTELAEAGQMIANVEGLEAHAKALEIRAAKKDS